jgi:hypothetical protein
MVLGMVAWSVFFKIKSVMVFQSKDSYKDGTDTMDMVQ